MDSNPIKNQLNQLGIQPKKSLGQNFLINPSVSGQITHAIQKLQAKHIIEIGPGIGSLTHWLTPLKIPLTLVELDSRLYRFWKQKNLNVIQKDVLKLTNDEFHSPCTVVGNLPYPVASQLVIKSCLEWNRIESMVLMMQKEVGDRILSPPGKKTFGWLSVISQLIWDCHLLTVVKASDFYPKPKVDGSIIVFQRRPQQKIEIQSFFQFVKTGFQQKRKFLKTNLKNAGICADAIQKTFQQMNLSLSARAEELSIPKWIQLHSHLKKTDSV